MELVCTEAGRTSQAGKVPGPPKHRFEVRGPDATSLVPGRYYEVHDDLEPFTVGCNSVDLEAEMARVSGRAPGRSVAVGVVLTADLHEVVVEAVDGIVVHPEEPPVEEAGDSEDERPRRKRRSE